MTFEFNEDILKYDLERISHRKRIAFAASCSERLLPGYIFYVKFKGDGNVATLRGALDLIWSRVISGEEANKISDNLVASIEALFIDEDDEYLVERAAAEDAVAAVYYTLICFNTGGIQEAAWVARRAYEAIDEYVSHQNSDTEFDENRILQNELIQEELRIQHDDLQKLKSEIISFKDIVESSKKAAKYFLPWYKDVIH